MDGLRTNLLQAQNDAATAAANLAERTSSAQNDALTAQNAGVEYAQWLQDTITQYQETNQNNYTTSMISAFNTYTWTVAGQQWSDMTAVEQQWLLQIAWANNLDQSKTVAIEQLCSSLWTDLTKNPTAVYNAIQAIINGTPYAQAMAIALGWWGGW
jgi:hypothetical protein